MKSIIILIFCISLLVYSKKIDDILKEIDDEQSQDNLNNGIYELTSQTFRKMVNEKNYTFVMFYDPTCPHCKKLIPRFNQLGIIHNNQPNFRLARLDCDLYHSYCHKQSFLKGYPSLFLFYNNYIYPEYSMSYSPEAMKDWIELMIKTTNKDEHFDEHLQKVEL
ncbi:protein disulfide isomerase, putative [Entamoeba dispar SAW760]|uniref:Protein disulfide isomerase, putative n=1 Tax=Entamoeba dispar (strain ATCC PRA-260 / SAW760) TaxID=370354 RepID=B0EIW3_ENTDS|nr:protein disulfide isomerase, putative [Entamoeba dispar SAW760]EDR25531.1 protein disulfide isomerase, putative [Entamoeba dispar SAW760]|eukprot:EDR25531.1 protein disulfide isomerase, putative [Entamoeba dispar SAW760]